MSAQSYPSAEHLWRSRSASVRTFGCAVICLFGRVVIVVESTGVVSTVNWWRIEWARRGGFYFYWPARWRKYLPSRFGAKW